MPGASGAAKLLRSSRCGTVVAMALPKPTDVTALLQAPGSAGSMSANEPPAPPRVTLPRNLSTTLRGLVDVDLETLQREVAAEIKRRRSAKPTETIAKVPPPQGLSPAKAAAADVPTGNHETARNGGSQFQCSSAAGHGVSFWSWCTAVGMSRSLLKIA